MAVSTHGRPTMKMKFDRSIRPLLERFLARCRENLRDFDRALETKDFAAIVALGHGLGGAGGTYGLAEVSALGRGIEQAARGRDGERIAALLAELRRFIADLEPEFD